MRAPSWVCSHSTINYNRVKPSQRRLELGYNFPEVVWVFLSNSGVLRVMKILVETGFAARWTPNKDHAHQ